MVEGEIEAGKIYEEKEFNRTGGIEIEARERKRVELMMREIDQNEKTIVFCANQAHACLLYTSGSRGSPTAKSRARPGR